MSNLEETEGEGCPCFRWGTKGGVGRTNKQVQFYKSFTLGGQEYALYDSVYLRNIDEPEPFIGKLVKIYEMPTLEKKGKVVWYFRPVEIVNFLNSYKPSNNEIFLASGEGIGVSNIIPLESIIEKCNVACVSDDRRNPRPSGEELNKAEYIFNLVFDVEKLRLEERFPEKISGIEVEHFFNKMSCQRLNYPKKPRARVGPTAGKSILSHRRGSDCAIEDGDSSMRLHPAVKGDFLNSSLRTGFKTAIEGGNSSSRLQPVVKGAYLNFSWGIGSDKAIEGGNSSSRLQPVVKGDFLNCSRRTGWDKTIEGGNSGSKLEPFVKDSKGGAVDVDKLVHLQNDNTTSGSKSFVGNSGFGPSKTSCSRVRNEAETNSESKRGAVDVDKQGRLQSGTSRPKISAGNSGSRPSKISCSQVRNEAEVGSSEDIRPTRIRNLPFKKRRVCQDEKTNKEQFTCDGFPKTDCGSVEVTRNPSDRKSWFKQLPWEERMQRAHKVGTLLSLENLDPSFTSSEVEDLVRHALGQRVEAKMLQHSTFCSPHYGKALVIFKSKDAADMAMSKLKRRCLLLSDGRPVIVNQGSLPEPSKPSSFIGHLVLDKLVYRKQHTNMKEAVSTSHCAQPNTIEFDMAMPWCLLQERSEIEWRTLYKNQGKEIQRLRSQLKMIRDSKNDI